MTQLARDKDGVPYLTIDQARHLDNKRVYRVLINGSAGFSARFLKTEEQWWWDDGEGGPLPGMVTHVDFGS